MHKHESTYETMLSSKNARILILKMAFCGNAVHIGCAFSLVEILVVLYRNFMESALSQLTSHDRNFLILSKGHGVMAQYACLALLNTIPINYLDEYFSDGSYLLGLSETNDLGSEVNSGSLGHGFSIGVGIAYGHKLRGVNHSVFTIVGDGELNEGSIWEGAMFAAHHRLNNFIVIVDQNLFQAMGSTSEVISMENIADKFNAFGFEVVSCDGHDENELLRSISSLIASGDTRPKALVAKTVKGKGISFMEGNNSWHYSRLNDETFASAMQELGETI